MADLSGIPKKRRPSPSREATTGFGGKNTVLSDEIDNVALDQNSRLSQERAVQLEKDNAEITAKLKASEEAEKAAADEKKKLLAEIEIAKKNTKKGAGRPVTSDKTATFTTSMNPEFKIEFKLASVKHGIDMNQMIETALRSYMTKLDRDFEKKNATTS